MIFEELKLKGAYRIDLEKRGDSRGFFARVFCAEEFAELGLETNFVQSNWSFSETKNTLRGMHFQTGEFQEVKLVRCVRGALLDVIVDMRESSDTYLQYHMEELTHVNGRMLYIPKGFAHGFLTIEKDSEIFYQVSNYYNKESEGGLHWNDPKVNIKWPFEEDPIVSIKDTNLKFLK